MISQLGREREEGGREEKISRIDHRWIDHLLYVATDACVPRASGEL
jgi:hypothetical protein